MKKYSEFINFPIFIWSTKEVDVDVPADEDESSDEEESCMQFKCLKCLYLLPSYVCIYVHIKKYFFCHVCMYVFNMHRFIIVF